MSRILRGIAIAAGAGLAVGFGSVLAGRRLKPVPALPREEVLKLEPLLDRMDQLESETGTLRKQIGQVTVNIDAAIDLRVDQMRQRLEAEVDARHKSALAAFEKSVDDRVSARIAAIERSLLDQSISIGALRERAESTDANLQRLIVAIEKLCERTPPPFQTQLDRAMEDPQPQQEYRETKKPRMPMARIFGTILTAGLSRFLTK